MTDSSQWTAVGASGAEPSGSDDGVQGATAESSDVSASFSFPSLSDLPSLGDTPFPGGVPTPPDIPFLDRLFGTAKPDERPVLPPPGPQLPPQPDLKPGVNALSRGQQSTVLSAVNLLQGARDLVTTDEPEPNLVQRSGVTCADAAIHFVAAARDGTPGPVTVMINATEEQARSAARALLSATETDTAGNVPRGRQLIDSSLLLAGQLVGLPAVG
jgi:hypothetical protein